MESKIMVGDIVFSDAPSEIEGSPFFVDLWAAINGYRIGLQVKPGSYSASSRSIYGGKAMSAHKKGLELFKHKFTGKAFIGVVEKGVVDNNTRKLIIEERNRLMMMEKGPFEEL